MEDFKLEEPAAVINGFGIYEREDMHNPGGNVFEDDFFHLGTQLGFVGEKTDSEAGNRIIILHSNHPTEKCKYLIIVNEKTGKKIKIVI